MPVKILDKRHVKYMMIIQYYLIMFRLTNEGTLNNGMSCNHSYLWRFLFSSL